MLLAVTGFCNVWFSADDDPDLRVRIRPLWLQRICRFFFVVAVVLLPVLDVLIIRAHPLDESDVIVKIANLIFGFFVVGIALIILALVFYVLCSFVAFCLKQLAKYVWNE